MTIARNILSGLITFFLIPLIVTFLFVSNFTNVLLNETNFLGTLKENQTYTKIASDILPDLIINSVSGNADREGLPKEVVSKLVGSVNKEQLAGDLEKTFGDIYRFSTNKDSNLNTVINIEPYIQTLQTNLKPIFLSYYQTLPACTAEQVDSQTTVCQQPGVNAEQAASQAEIDKTINELTKSAPKTITITKNEIVFDPPLNTEQNEQRDNTFSQLEDTRNATKNVQPAVNGTLLLIVIMLLLLVLSHLPKLVSILRSLSWVLFSASVIPLLLSSIFLIFVKPQTVQETLSKSVNINPSSGYQETVFNLIVSNAFSLGEKIFHGIQLQSLILIVIAAILFGVAFFWEKRQNKAPITEKLTNPEAKI